MMQVSRRIRPHLRPLRPPNSWRGHLPRYFVRPPALLRVSVLPSRPQIPFLSPPAQCTSPGQWQVTRLMTTEQQRRFKKSAWDFAVALIGAMVIVPSGVALLWWTSHEMMERDFQTPHEWSFRTRCYWHTVKAMEDPSVTQGRIPNWTLIGNTLRKMMQRLEDPDIDGKGLQLAQKLDGAAGNQVFLDYDLSSAYDISSMPEAWRRSYVAGLLQFARVAEASEYMVFDKKNKWFHVTDFVVGPSNPDPTPLPASLKLPTPREEDCMPFSPSAEKFYEKLLATKGLTDRQRIDSLISYSQWLELKDRPEDAVQKLQQALHIATSVLPNPSTVINPKTGAIKANAPFVTQNILDVSTALGIHFARKFETSTALSVFLSVLQAYRSAPSQGASDELRHQTYTGTIPADVLVTGLRDKVAGLFSTVEYPPPPASGNDPFVRVGDDYCNESAAMNYASELLFATSMSQRETALTWIKEAVSNAYDHVGNTSLSFAEREHCNQCLGAALDTWWNMAQTLKADAEAKQNTDFHISLRQRQKIEGPPRWRQEELEHWDWVKRIERDDWEEKMAFEQWKLWAWLPRSTLTRVI